MKTSAIAAFSLATTSAAAHPGHGAKGWFHQHQDELIDAAMVAFACLIAVGIVRLMWKLSNRAR